MKKLSIFIVLLIGVIISAQVPRFAKYNIADTGAQFYFPTEPKFTKALSNDKNEVYTASTIFANVDYGIIAVKLNEDAIKNNDLPEEKMISYVDFLNEHFLKFTKKTDYGKGHTLENQPDVIGILEYGETEDGTTYAVKAWTNKSMIVVMYIGSKKEVNVNFQEIYFKGIRFGK